MFPLLLAAAVLCCVVLCVLTVPVPAGLQLLFNLRARQKRGERAAGPGHRCWGPPGVTQVSAFGCFAPAEERKG